MGQQEAERQAQVREMRLHSELEDSASIQRRLEDEVASLKERLGELKSTLEQKLVELDEQKASTAASAQKTAADHGEAFGGLQQRLQAEVV